MDFSVNRMALKGIRGTNLITSSVIGRKLTLGLFTLMLGFPLGRAVSPYPIWLDINGDWVISQVIPNSVRREWTLSTT